jgi:hypothetical protein
VVPRLDVGREELVKQVKGLENGRRRHHHHQQLRFGVVPHQEIDQVGKQQADQRTRPRASSEVPMIRLRCSGLLSRLPGQQAVHASGAMVMMMAAKLRRS